MDGPRACFAEDDVEIIDLINALFREGTGQNVRTDYPLLDDPAMLHNRRVIKLDGKVVAHRGGRRPRRHRVPRPACTRRRVVRERNAGGSSANTDRPRKSVGDSETRVSQTGPRGCRGRVSDASDILSKPLSQTNASSVSAHPGGFEVYLL